MLSKFTTHGSSVAQVYAWDYYAKLFGQHPVEYIKPVRVDVASVPSWRELMGRWEQPDSQHDVAEFMSHICQSAPIADMTGMWSAFQGERNTDESDLSKTVLPLVVSRLRNIQQCIDLWHEDGETRRFLVIAPRLIVLQLLRFRVTSGRIRKLSSKVDIPEMITVPAYLDAQPSNITYRIAAGIFHIGSTPSSGHYRAFVMHFDQFRSCRCLITDDNQRSQNTTPQIDEQIKSNVYLLFCVRVDA